ncbi:hypothetical protein [Microcystis aeruginosa]|uniref:hypothetical protein n=1 Tax=Microcystis aeruginosa TaxID=1126 RepID=UPI001F4F4B2E|nr:hypothetical protein [Microcystis aeruginosa]
MGNGHSRDFSKAFSEITLASCPTSRKRSTRRVEAKMNAAIASLRAELVGEMASNEKIGV